MDERQKILKMVEDGKITAQDAIELLDALGRDEKPADGPAVKTPGRKKMLRVRIDAGEKGSGKGRAKVNVNLPLSVAKKLTSLSKVIPEEARSEMEKGGFNIDDLNLAELLEAIENGEMDESIVDIEANDDGDGSGATVKIYVD
ncbi:MAG: hypothetical protein JXB33_03810 [Clostridia bacterium]|nr:hypothetical protein [Clostridia bacterium]